MKQSSYSINNIQTPLSISARSRVNVLQSTLQNSNTTISSSDSRMSSLNNSQEAFMNSWNNSTNSMECEPADETKSEIELQIIPQSNERCSQIDKNINDFLSAGISLKEAKRYTEKYGTLDVFINKCLWVKTIDDLVKQVYKLGIYQDDQSWNYDLCNMLKTKSIDEVKWLFHEVRNRCMVADHRIGDVNSKIYYDKATYITMISVDLYTLKSLDVYKNESPTYYDLALVSSIISNFYLKYRVKEIPKSIQLGNKGEFKLIPQDKVTRENNKFIGDLVLTGFPLDGVKRYLEKYGNFDLLNHRWIKTTDDLIMPHIPYKKLSCAVYSLYSKNNPKDSKSPSDRTVSESQRAAKLVGKGIDIVKILIFSQTTIFNPNQDCK